ncbi:hypothetical protein N658DRAFT_498843 [Parathielavia hyrcaniae]|uniref:DUF6594 domain-containing protein n=1 Tax=Parathielavia hyrcaniae TaxID=113614 RepID=A0AAN6PW33_9PEZI|nr:hypothetical protein N658DRAFT_498843 [Parathielavia hyrcaniae]
MASRIPDEEVGVVPASSAPARLQDSPSPSFTYASSGPDTAPPSSRPSTRTGRSSPPPQLHESSSTPRAYSAQAGGTAALPVPTGDVANDQLDIANSDRWIWKNFGQYLVTKVKPWPFKSANQGEESFEVNLAEVQRMYLVQLRIRLARHIARWELSGGRKLRNSWDRRRTGKDNGNGVDGQRGGDDDEEEMEEEGCWEDDLHRYVQGLQDYDYMDKCNQESSSDPFRMTGENKLDRLILDTSLGDARSRRFDSMHVRDVRQWDGHMRAIIPSRTDNQYKRLLSRLVVSAIGAGFLIGPMWLMMIQRGLHVALVSTTVFVAVFGALAAFFLDSHAHVLSSTAAYAAVLVVFVGLTSEESTTEGQ